jgi:uncharacterized Zn-binding protein involved in type VI secretion
MIGDMPAWRTLMDFHACPIVKGVVPDVGGMVMMGSPTVLINDMMSCRVGDMVVEIPGGPNAIVMGCMTVMIGVAGMAGVVIIPPDFIGPPAPNQMTQAEYDAALATLERIAKGDSQIKIDGLPLYKGQALAALARLMSRPTGRGLVNDLDKAPNSTTIHLGNSVAKGNTENAANWNNGLYDAAHGKPGPGSDNTVDWNPDRKKINGEPWQTRDPSIGLGHELVHSYHDVHGTTDGQNPVPYTDANGNARSAPGYELQAAGLGPHSGDPYTENGMRSDAGEPPRPRY